MESVSRASDTERLAWSHTHSVTAEPVKEEPVWGDGVTEAAAAEGLYAGHDVKDELVVGPELIQIQDVALSMTCPLNGAKEDPCKLEPGDGARAAPAGPPTRRRGERGEEGPRCSTSHQQHIKPKRCSVRLERFPIEHIPTCNNCLITFHSKSSLKNHSCTNLLKSNFDKETAKFKKHTTLTSHTGEAGNQSIRDIQFAHNSTLTELTPAHTAEKAYSCFMCRKKFAQPWHLKSHMRVHTAKKPFYCNVCKKKFVLKDKLAKHRRVHEDEKIFSCDLCKKKFRTKPRLVIHMRVHTGEKPFSCGVCDKKFADKSNLRSHKRSHGEKLYICHICQKKFFKEASLTSHLWVHADIKPFSCSVCQKQFAHRKALSRHMMIHTDKPFSCDICKKKFRIKSRLVIHMRMHTGEKPFSCGVCDKKFAYYSNLLTHKRSHSEKLYICHICQKKFLKEASLTLHLWVHADKKPFSCSVCQKQFAHRKALSGHMIIHTDEKPFSCYVCKKQFKHRSTLAHHIQKHMGRVKKLDSCDICRTDLVENGHPGRQVKRCTGIGHHFHVKSVTSG